MARFEETENSFLAHKWRGVQELLTGQLNAEQEACHADRMMLIYSLTQALEFLHAHNVIHRAIHPASFVWFPTTCTWKLVGFGSSAASGCTAPLDYDLSYTPPELVQADHLGRVRPATS